MADVTASDPLEADVVIVGAGSAGCVVAARLSEEAGLKVLLLEAGDRQPSFVSDVPAMTVRLVGNPSSDWSHLAEPDPTLDGRRLIWSGGRMVGGSSSINGLVYIRGLQRDYDDWASAGCHGWGWKDVEPFFQRAEGFGGKGSPSLGRDGPLSVCETPSLQPLSRKFIEACAQLQMPPLPDYNAGDCAGAFANMTTQRHGRRSSTARAYLEPARRRHNLQVVRGALVDRILFEGRRAVGVVALMDGNPRHIIARRQVVLSAGSIMTPAILLRSGIGSAAHLRELGIEVLANRTEVGANLQDHIGIMVCKHVNRPTYNSDTGPISGLRHLANYLMFRRGPLASPVVQAMAWARSDPGLAAPDLHLNWFPFGIDYNAHPPALHKRPAVSLFACVSRPHARGSVSLKSADAHRGPAITHRLIDDSRDLAALKGALRLIERVFATPALSPFVTGPAAPFQGTETEDEAETLLRRYAGLGLHAAGTCRMGSDPKSVVHTDLRVREIGGLSVVDASVMPRLVSANTNAAAIMIGERGAAFLKQSLRQDPAG